MYLKKWKRSGSMTVEKTVILPLTICSRLTIALYSSFLIHFFHCLLYTQHPVQSIAISSNHSIKAIEFSLIELAYVKVSQPIALMCDDISLLKITTRPRFDHAKCKFYHEPIPKAVKMKRMPTWKQHEGNENLENVAQTRLGGEFEHVT